MADDLDVATRCARTVALLHPTVIRRAPIGMYYLYEDRRLRLRVSDQAGLDDYGVWEPARGDDWNGGASVVPLRGGIRAAADISSGRLDRVSARFVGVQEPGVAGLAGGPQVRIERG